MARIRSIKPEFPQSESMGNVSRDARLLFVMLWPICDDHGRTRASSRLLASLLFPYDADAGALIDGWLAELRREKCIRLYEVNGSTFLEIANWLIHQKIDKPSKPQFPLPPEDSRDLSTIREDSSSEGKGREGKGEEGTGGAAAPPAAANDNSTTTKRATRLPADWTPTREQLDWARGERTDLDIPKQALGFRDFWIAKPGKDGTKLDWDATWRNWIRNARAAAFAGRGDSSQPRHRQQLA